MASIVDSWWAPRSRTNPHARTGARKQRVYTKTFPVPTSALEAVLAASSSDAHVEENLRWAAQELAEAGWSRTDSEPLRLVSIRSRWERRDLTGDELIATIKSLDPIAP